MSSLHPDNGAPFQKPKEFFTNEKSLKAYRNRLRYFVARYGYSTSIFDDYASQSTGSSYRYNAYGIPKMWNDGIRNSNSNIDNHGRINTCCGRRNRVL